MLVEPFDAMLDLALSEKLRTSFMPVAIGDDDATWAQRGELWRDDRTLIGASDAGAHLDMLDAFALTTNLLSEGVRRHGLISLEGAIHQITDLPARLFGLRERGRIEVGWVADVVVFDPVKVRVNATFTDEASITAGVSCGSNPGISGDVRPVQSLTKFDGRATNVVWHMIVGDDGFLDQGQVESWCLTLTYTTP